MRVLVTGGAGGLGITICHVLHEAGFEVRVLDLNNPANRKRVRVLAGRSEVQWGDVTDPISVENALSGIDAVIHLAGLLPPTTEEQPEMAHRVNVGGTENLITGIKQSGKTIPLVFASSTLVFGPTPEAKAPLSLESNPPNPRMTYSKTKWESENRIRESGIDHVILRCTSIPYLSLSIGQMRDLMFTIPLDNRLEFCHIDDAAAAMVKSISLFDSARNRTLVIAGGPTQRMLYRDMIGTILSTFGLPLPPAGRFTTEPYELDWYDTTESQSLLSYQHKTLDDYARDLRRQLPTPVPTIMQYAIGPLLGGTLARLLLRPRS